MPPEKAKGPDPPSGPWPPARYVPPGFSIGSRCAPQPLRHNHIPRCATFPGKIAVRRRTVRFEAKVVLVARRALSELPGEDLTTSVLPEVAGWISIYEEMASVLRSVIARANGNPDAAAHAQQLGWIEGRLVIWRDRHAELAGVVIDRKDHMLTYAGKSLRLTRRGAEPLEFMLRHPRRPFTSKQLATLAGQKQHLPGAQVSHYTR